jgi:hypothetical protein
VLVLAAAGREQAERWQPARHRLNLILLVVANRAAEAHPERAVLSRLGRSEARPERAALGRRGRSEAAHLAGAILTFGHVGMCWRGLMCTGRVAFVAAGAGGGSTRDLDCANI